MTAAGFHLSLIDGHIEPGIWVATATVDGKYFLVPVDLIVKVIHRGGQLYAPRCSSSL